MFLFFFFVNYSRLSHSNEYLNGTSDIFSENLFVFWVNCFKWLILGILSKPISIYGKPTLWEIRKNSPKEFLAIFFLYLFIYLFIHVAQNFGGLFVAFVSRFKNKQRKEPPLSTFTWDSWQIKNFLRPAWKVSLNAYIERIFF